MGKLSKEPKSKSVSISLVTNDQTIIDDILGSSQSVKIEEGITIHRSQLKLKAADAWFSGCAALIQIAPYVAPIALDHLLTFLYNRWKHDPKRTVKIEELEVELGEQEKIRRIICRQMEASRGASPIESSRRPQTKKVTLPRKR